MKTLEIKKVTLDGKSFWKLRCPECEQWGALEDHVVDVDDGSRITISPSVVCGERGCSFHEQIVNEAVQVVK